MSQRRPRSERERRSPTQTLANATDELVADLHLPPLPDHVPQRLADAMGIRVQALLFRLREAKTRHYLGVLEKRVVRDAMQAVLAANELGLPDAEAWYAEFRHLVEDLGYEHVDAGFVKRQDADQAD